MAELFDDTGDSIAGCQAAASLCGHELSGLPLSIVGKKV
ncbi:unnamed protein product, partial [marine sediment metagenome]